MKRALRLAAVGDLHCKLSSSGQIAPLFAHIREHADALLLCGDLTDYGLLEEARILAEELKEVCERIPILSILGNHDYQSGRQAEILELLSKHGIIPLDGNSYEICGVAFTGTKGFAGGFNNRALQAWGEDAIKAFVEEARLEAMKLESSLAQLRSRQRVVLLHYSPVRETVIGESGEIFPFLGSSFLEEALNRHPVSVVFHSHAHNGSPKGYTSGQIPVFNVSLSLMKQLFSEQAPYRIFQIEGECELDELGIRQRSKVKVGNPAPRSNAPSAERKSPSDSKRRIYRSALDVLTRSNFPFLVGGAFALNFYTGIWRDTKDIDLFILPQDYERGLQILAHDGFKTDRTFPHWLGKASYGEHEIDIIFSSGNAIGKVDPLWFKHAVGGEILGTRVRICPPEEMIWSKAFVMERERYDGADIMHLLLSQAGALDWVRLLDRFDVHWRILLSHLVLFGFVYPSERSKIPESVMKKLTANLTVQSARPSMQERICRGTLLSRTQYRIDVEQWGYSDARLRPLGGMTEEEISLWSAPQDKAGERVFKKRPGSRGPRRPG